MSSNEVKLSNHEVEQLATAAGISVEQLLNKVQEAGAYITAPEQTLSVQEKQKEKLKLLRYLQNKSSSAQHVSASSKEPSTTTLERTETNTSTLQVRGSGKITITRKVKKPLINQPIEEPLTTEESTVEPIQESIEQQPEVQPDQTPVLEKTTSGEKTAVDRESPILQSEERQSHALFSTIENNIPQKIEPLAQTEKVKEKFTPTKTKKHIPNKFNKQATSSHRHTKTKNYKKETHSKHVFEKPSAPITREITIPEHITVTDLAKKMSIKAAEVIKQLIQMGIRATINQSLEQDVAILLVEEMGHIAKPLESNPLEIELQESIDQNMGEEVTRPPIVTIMGHVDHGKTSLLDYIRRTKVASKEAGGITQHIGAYHVNIPKGILTFLDTPGHAAFTAMRARGARLTDIVILVVAADDGVMPQTIEAIQHAKAANVPIVVAINKMDKPGVTTERVQQELAQHELIPEDWGGDTLFIPVSAKTGQGIDDLLESLLIQAEMLELKAPTTGSAQGIIIESRLEKGRGPVATVLVQRGTLNKGDILLAGTSFGRVRALYDETGKGITSAGPSIPAEILGLSNPPTAGDEAIVVANERKAREIAFARSAMARESKLKSQRTQHMEDLLKADSGNHKTLNVILKTDVQGSAEALHEALTKLSNEEITVKPLATGIGAITESDVNLALASKAVVLGFNVRADSIAKQLVERENVVMHYHTIIYELLDQVKQMMSGMLEPLIKENTLGLATVREIFRSAKTGTIAGCYVTDGRIQRGYPIRILRNNVIVHQGDLHSVRRFKDDVKEVREGTECGISLKNYTDLQVGDIIENYERITVARTL
jgi:translation initiation factor IF-2